MKHTLIGVALATTLVSVTHAVRSTPDFSGNWTYDPARSSKAQRVIVRGDGARNITPTDEELFPSLGFDLTVTQVGNTLTFAVTPRKAKQQTDAFSGSRVEADTLVDVSRYSLMFLLDGSESSNRVPDPGAIGGQTQTLSFATWTDDALVIVTTPKSADPTIRLPSVVRRLRLGTGGALLVEETREMAMTPVTSTTVYVRKQ